MTPRLDDGERLLAALIAAPSPNPPGDERAVADVVRSAALELGLPEPRTYARRAERPNLVLSIGDGSPHLVLAAHMDTMPAGDLAAWTTDPHTLTRVDDRFVGLGVADMKAAIAAMLIAAARVLRSAAWRGRLTLIFSADEENGSAQGMGWLAGHLGITADAAVMVEPASVTTRSFDRLFVAQRGSCVARLVALGRPGHSAEEIPSRERAGAALADALTALHAAELFPDVRHPVDGTPARVNVATMIDGGTVPFAHPAELHACLEVRTLEGQTQDGVLAELRGAIRNAGLEGRVRILPADPPLDWIPPGRTVTDERLLDAATASWRAVTGTEPRLGVMTGTTDSLHLDVRGIPTLPAFGPGSLAVAHRPNESIAVDDLPRAVELLAALTLRYLRPAP